MQIPIPRRAALVLLLAHPAMAQPAPGSEAAWQALAEGGIVLFRHALAPGGGDPPGMRLGECGTQRNLNEEGRAQARRIGAAFRDRGITVGAVRASGWCRAMETAELAFPGRVVAEPAFNSFFSARQEAETRTAAARQLISGWDGPGALFVATHQVNITALTGIFPASGEGIVLRRDGTVVGRIRP